VKNPNGIFWDGQTLVAERLADALGTWSAGERVLARVALDLWEFQDPENSRPPLRLRELFDGLDWPRVRAVLEALALSAAWIAPGDRLTVEDAGGAR
jgi:hypothetical protein